MFNDDKNTLPQQIDLNELARRHDLRIVVEPQEPQSVIKARHAQERLEAGYRRRKDWLLFKVALFSAIFLGGMCVLIIFTKFPGPEHANWATATLTSLVTSTIAYLSGRSG